MLKRVHDMTGMLDSGASDMNESEHLTPAHIAAYIDHGLAPGAADRVEQHLDACAECRAELHASACLADSWTNDTVSEEPRLRSQRQWMPVALGGVLAAAVGLVIVTGPALLNRSQRSDSVRAPYFNEGRARIIVIAPASDSIVTRHGLAFTWHRSGASLYRLTILRESGDPLYTVETQDTSVILPDSVSLAPRTNYFWRVEGVGNGIVSTTGATRLQLRP